MTTGTLSAAKIKKAMQDLKGSTLKVGFFEDAKYNSGEPIAYIASIHEFGVPSKGIPPRPFMRPTAKAESSKWCKAIGSGMKPVLAGQMSVSDVLEAVGGRAAGDVKKTITKLTSPALKDGTIAARKRRLAKGTKVKGKTINKPLVDTGTLLAAVTFEVGGQ